MVGLKEAEAETNVKTVVIVDEADHFFIDELAIPMKARCVVGLTATLPEPSDEEGKFVERRLRK